MKDKKKEIEELIYTINLKFTDEDKINIQKLINSYFRKKNIPNSKNENLAGGLLWVYSRINFLFQYDKNWSQKEIALKLGIESKSISRISSSLMEKLKITHFDERFARKEVLKKSPFTNFFMTKEGFILDKKHVEEQLLNRMREKFAEIKDIISQDEFEGVNLTKKDKKLHDF